MNSPVYIVVSIDSGEQLLPGSFPFAALAALEIVKSGLEAVARVEPAKLQETSGHYCPPGKLPIGFANSQA